MGFDPYSGKRPGEQPTKDVGGDVVRSLASKLQPGSCIFADRFFSSPKLVHDLLKDGKFYVGTCMSNRKYFPKELVAKTKKEKMERGCSYAAVCDNTNMRVVAWKDNKTFFMVASAFNPYHQGTCKRRVDCESKEVSIPEIVQVYNKYMGGVDLSDQLRANYPVEKCIRTNLWYMKLFLGLFSVSIANA